MPPSDLLQTPGRPRRRPRGRRPRRLLPPLARPVVGPPPGRRRGRGGRRAQGRRPPTPSCSTPRWSCWPGWACSRVSRPDAREAARQRLVWLAAHLRGRPGRSRPRRPTGDHGRRRPPPASPTPSPPATSTTSTRYAVALGRRATPDELGRLLAEPVAASLAAAAHGSILLVPAAPGGAARRAHRHGPARPGPRAGPHTPTGACAGSRTPTSPIAGTPPGRCPARRARARAAGQHLHPPGHEPGRGERAGRRACWPDVLVRATWTPPRRDLARVAAWSMLQEPTDHAPYGWSHCLTMPQAVLALAGQGRRPRRDRRGGGRHPRRRASAPPSARCPSTAGGRPSARPPATSPRPSSRRPGPRRGRGVARPRPTSPTSSPSWPPGPSLHHDAHLVKYTLACLDAAADDPDQRRLYLASAAYLSAWWAAQPPDGFLLA